jgi:uncharacterized surface protein with fasciclin (FAS1) repeats
VKSTLGLNQIVITIVMEKSYKIFGFLVFGILFIGIQSIAAQSVFETLKSNGQTSEFAAALENAGLDDRLSGNSGSFTVFAPSNNAFAQVDDKLKTDSNFLLNHIITGSATKRSLQHMSQVTCLSGITIEIVKMDNGSLSIENYPLEQSNIRAGNGVIHIINGVIQ